MLAAGSVGGCVSSIPAATPPPSATPPALPSGNPVPTRSADPSVAATPVAPAAGTPGLPVASPSPGFSLRVPILTYHVIAPWAVARAYALPALAVDPALFDAQLAALRAADWRTITTRELANALASGREVAPRTFVITIDDGHADGATYALPVLRKYGDVATFYVVAGRIGNPHNLTWAQVAELAAEGMEIGNHTLGHQVLSRLPGAEVRTQVDSAQALLTSALGSAPTTFAYPFGAFDAGVESIVRQAGFSMAVTTEAGSRERWDRRLEAPRIEVGASFSPAEVLAKMTPSG
ncbi:MAG: polysaccharide deacetylase family protein [Chloroflexi bacterium]|nr:polysaccharide deacetylase family protein [Chloroflexota bacterium]